MDQSDVQWWSLVIGLAVFVSAIAAVYLRRRHHERRHGPMPRLHPISGRPIDSPAPSTTDTTPPAPFTPASAARDGRGRRRAADPPPVDTPEALALAIRSLILRTTAERAPVGWSALVLSPPPHGTQMIWHVHLAPAVALDLRDGRTVPVAAPEPSHQWQVAGGRSVGVAEGDPDPPPTDETAAIRVTGPYLIVSVSKDDSGAPLLVAHAVETDGGDLPRPRAAATDPRAVQAALREAIELAVSLRMGGTPPVVGYPPASWAGHERTWLTSAG